MSMRPVLSKTRRVDIQLSCLLQVFGIPIDERHLRDKLRSLTIGTCDRERIGVPPSQRKPISTNLSKHTFSRRRQAQFAGLEKDSELSFEFCHFILDLFARKSVHVTAHEQHGLF